MSTFLFDFLDFVFTTKFSVLFVIPVPFYCISLFFRAFSFGGD